MVIIVVLSSGYLVWVIMFVVVCKCVWFFCVLIKIFLIIIIVLFINIFKVIISVFNEICCRLILKYCMKMKVFSIVKSRIRLINSFECSFIKNNNMMIMMVIVCLRFIIKLLIDLLIFLGWLYILVILILIGCWYLSLVKWWLKCCLIFIMLMFWVNEIFMLSVSLLLKVIMLFGIFM